MPVDAEVEAARHRWASAANERLALVTAAVERLREVYMVERDAPSEASAAVASVVVTACGSLAGWLSSARAPRGFGKAEGELGAAAGVYRNAAVAFRSLEDADGNQRRARSNACLALLEQGDHHVEIFAEALAKKLGDGKS